MRILVHDYSGHPFQVQLSRALARHGHQIRHVYSSSFQTPKGNISRLPGDPTGFDIQPVALPEEFRKDSFLVRRAQEVVTGRLVAGVIRAFRPDIVVSSNAPLDTQDEILRETRRIGAKFVFWLQDIYSEAIRRVVSKRLPAFGRIVGAYYHRREYHMLKAADHVVPITDDFVGLLVAGGVRRDRITVVENWAPLPEMIPTTRDNFWADEHMPHPGLRVVYSGTLGYKHNPQLLIDIARSLDGHVYVFSEGRVADALAADASAAGVTNLSVRPWVPFEDLPKMLSGADLFVAMIEEDAGIFSVPSKVLSYLCIGRPIAASIPEGNLARRIILREGAGVVENPGRSGALLQALAPLLADPTIREQMGHRARAYAERTFDIELIADRFEKLLVGL